MRNEDGIACCGPRFQGVTLTSQNSKGKDRPLSVFHTSALPAGRAAGKQVGCGPGIRAAWEPGR